MTTSITNAIPGPPGTELTRFNALRHGVLSRYTILPWEDAEEYAVVLASLVAEHQPRGPTEEHLVEELAGVLWRKRRLRLAEAAAHRRGLEGTFSSYGKTAKAALAHLTKVDETLDVSVAVQITQADAEEQIRELEQDEAMTHRALDILGSRRNDSYEAAFAELREDTQRWWADTVKLGPDELEHDEEPATADAEGLRRFLEGKVLPWYEDRRTEIANRPLLREQAFGESLDPDMLERLGRYEVHLDRKLERMLSMLLRLRGRSRSDPFGKKSWPSRFIPPTRARVDATVAFRLSPQSAARRLFIGTSAKGRSARRAVGGEQMTIVSKGRIAALKREPW